MVITPHYIATKSRLNAFNICPTFIQPASSECQAKVEQKLDEVFKRVQHETQLFGEQRKSRKEVEQKFNPIQT